VGPENVARVVSGRAILWLSCRAIWERMRVEVTTGSSERLFWDSTMKAPAMAASKLDFQMKFGKRMLDKGHEAYHEDLVAYLVLLIF